MINVSPLVDTIINFAKPFLKEKIRNRIFVHSDMESLYKYVPKDMLPEEYGGTAGKVQDLHGKFHISLLSLSLNPLNALALILFINVY